VLGGKISRLKIISFKMTSERGVFEFDGYEEKWNYVLVVLKLEMHGNQKTSYGMERQHRQVDG